METETGSVIKEGESPVDLEEESGSPNLDPDGEIHSNGMKNVSVEGRNNAKNQSLIESSGENDHKSEDQEMNETEKTDSDDPPLFSLTVVNSYGSQEVQKLESSKTYRLSSE